MTNPNLFVCAKCGAEIITDGTPYYAFCAEYDSNGKVINLTCHTCSAEQEMINLLARNEGWYYMKHAGTERGMGLTTRNVYVLTAWNGHFKIPIRFYTHGKHNWAGKRTDVWFMLDGSVWHGTVYGSIPGDCHIKRTKYTSLDKVR